MVGKNYGYFENIVSAKEEAERKKKDKTIKERLQKIDNRLKKPFFKPSKKTKTRGSGMQVSASAGIKGLLKI